jgi:hypothetical protein
MIEVDGRGPKCAEPYSAPLWRGICVKFPLYKAPTPFYVTPDLQLLIWWFLCMADHFMEWKVLLTGYVIRYMDYSMASVRCDKV